MKPIRSSSKPPLRFPSSYLPSRRFGFCCSGKLEEDDYSQSARFGKARVLDVTAEVETAFFALPVVFHRRPFANHASIRNGNRVGVTNEVPVDCRKRVVLKRIHRVVRPRLAAPVLTRSRPLFVHESVWETSQSVSGELL